MQPTDCPSGDPTGQPSVNPASMPSSHPSASPSDAPSTSPSDPPSASNTTCDRKRKHVRKVTMQVTFIVEDVRLVEEGEDDEEVIKQLKQDMIEAIGGGLPQEGD